MNQAEPRIIKKYPNRRLYDTAISSYITLEDVRCLVVEQVALKVIDARTQTDITYSTLLQIIMEQEERGPGLFSTDSLQQMIRAYGGSMQQVLSKMFEQGVESFLEQQRAFKKHAQMQGSDWMGSDPLQVMAEFVKKNALHWQGLQEQWIEIFARHMQEEKTSDTKQEASSPVDAEEGVSITP